ncbi:glycosyltransferase [Desulfovibrio ferrophilus]|uniref:Glycosyl transferase family 2 n=1 Tax=Desulfovibrio ferrophilus TaxID=241368 RepID=A0A2Z6AW85_9BACT|nr:glycosyltransferase [Desulfovibrio ferrophilus]BBD07514.1 glycosyl transferase family 2 [Desulfovibrio ferrophilus]
MPFQWNTLPTPLLEALMTGSTGKAHLARSALLALGAPQPLVDLGLTLLAEAWTHDPLDANLATQTLSLDAKLHLLPAPIKALLKQASKSQGKLRSLQPALAHARDEVSASEMLTLASQIEPFFPAVAHMLQAEGHFLAGRFEQAGEACRALDVPLPRIMNLEAECALRTGDRERAITRYRESLLASPWQVNTLMRLYDLVMQRDQTISMPKGETVVLLYSWNKADDLDKTLASLAASDAKEACIITLDNGSTDATPQVVDAWANRLGKRFSKIRLPSNIGAPAARNWLMTLPEVRNSRWTVYLDDDVELVPDWLGRLGAATEAYPAAGVWGCKVVDIARPAIIQNADLHLREPYDDSTLAHISNQPTLFEVTDLHHEGPDLGQFDYIRPCASVTGCCHMFSTAKLLQAGEFDIRFSPTQLDDLEHDLRLLLAGHIPVYTGHLTVRHARLSGTKCAMSSAASGNAFGNQLKLQYKIGPDNAKAMRKIAAQALLDDVLTKQEALSL